MAEPQSSTAEAELWWLGLLLEAIGTLFCAAGKICWRYAATSTNNWYYCAGAVLTMGLYPMLDSLAYSFASQSLLGVSSGLVVLWNTALAPPLLGERLTVSRATGAAVVVVGTVCVALSGSHGNMTERSPAQLIRLLLSPSACLYYTGFLLWAACCASLRAAMLTDERRALVLAVGAGSLSGNMFTIKAGMTLLRCLFDTSCEHRADEPGALLADGIILLVLSAAVHGVALTLFALALRRGEALQMVVLYDGTFIFWNALSAAMVLHEFSTLGPLGGALYGCSLLVVAAGLGLLVRWPNALGDGDALCCVGASGAGDGGRARGKVPSPLSESSKLIP